MANDEHLALLSVDGCLDPRKDGAVACRGEASALGIDCRAVTGAGLSLSPFQMNPTDAG